MVGLFYYHSYNGLVAIQMPQLFAFAKIEVRIIDIFYLLQIPSLLHLVEYCISCLPSQRLSLLPNYRLWEVVGYKKYGSREV